MLSSMSFQADKKKDFLNKTVATPRDGLDLKEAKNAELSKAIKKVVPGNKVKKTMELSSSLHQADFYTDNMKGIFYNLIILAATARDRTIEAYELETTVGSEHLSLEEVKNMYAKRG